LIWYKNEVAAVFSVGHPLPGRNGTSQEKEKGGRGLGPTKSKFL